MRTAEADAEEIVNLYRSRGLAGAALRRMVARHAGILRAADPETSTALEDVPLRPVARRRGIARTRAESEWE